MYLAWAIEYAVQAGWARIVPFERLLSSVGLGAAESGVDRRVVDIVTVVSTLVSVASGLAVAILGFRSARFAYLLLLRASQLSSPVQKRVVSAVRAAMDFGFSWPRCRASHSSRMQCLNVARATASGQSTIWFFLVKNLVQNFLADSPGCWTL